jgi:hypothetical protein
MGSLKRYHLFEIQSVDEVHPAMSVVSEEAFGRPLMQLLHAFPDGLLQLHVCFLLCKRNISLLDR